LKKEDKPELLQPKMILLFDCKFSKALIFWKKNIFLDHEYTHLLQSSS
jgi:hypothetical protein